MTTVLEKAQREARPEAVAASRAIVDAYEIGGITDTAHIANIIEAELRRFETDPRAPLIENWWVGRDAYTGMTAHAMSQKAGTAKSGRAAQAAAIRIVRAYASAVGRKTMHDHALVDIAERIRTPAAPALEGTGDLDLINRHRARIGQPPLDPAAAGWAPEDVALEAARIRSLNPAALKRRLLR